MGGHMKNVWKLAVLVCLAIAFLFGGSLSFCMMRSEHRIHALAFSACFYVFIGVSCITYVKISRHISLCEAASGNWHHQWQEAFDALRSINGRGKLNSRDMLLDIFDDVDKDRSGFLDKDELQDALAAVGLVISEEAIRSMITFADDNGDGLISRDEWDKLIGQCVLTFEKQEEAIVRRSPSGQSIHTVKRSTSGQSIHTQRCVTDTV